MTIVRGKPTLSPQRRRVLQLAAAGYSSKESGEQMGIAEQTVMTHRRFVLSILGATNMTQAVALAFTRKLLP